MGVSAVPVPLMTRAELQTTFIHGCYDHADRLKAGSFHRLKPLEPYPGLLGYGHTLSDEARRDIESLRLNRGFGPIPMETRT
jgi:hypothetical protein